MGHFKQHVIHKDAQLLGEPAKNWAFTKLILNI